jgi:hypothetical protein
MLHMLARLLMRDVQPGHLYDSSPTGLLVFERSGGKQTRERSKKEELTVNLRSKKRHGMFSGCATVADVLAAVHEQIADAHAYRSREGAILAMTSTTHVKFAVNSPRDCRRLPSVYNHDQSEELPYKDILKILLGGVPPPVALLEYLGRLYDVLRAAGDAKKALALRLAREGLPDDLNCPARLDPAKQDKIRDEPFRELALGFSSHYFFYCLSAKYRFRSITTGILFPLLKVLPTLLNDEDGRPEIVGLRSPLMWSIGLDLKEAGFDLEKIEADEQRRKMVEDLRERLLNRNANAAAAALCRGWGSGYLLAVASEAQAGLSDCPLHPLKRL